MKVLKYSVIAGGIIVSILSIYILQTRIERFKDSGQEIEEFMNLPRGEYLKPAVMGYDQLVADILWLRAIQVIGEDTVTPQGYEWIYHALDVVTTLDPQFEYAYELGGVILSVLGNAPEKSNALLIKGARENPDVWRFPFYIGFNDFFYLEDYSSAAFYMARASMLPDHPAYLPKLAARLYLQAGDKGTAMEFLDRMIHTTGDDKIRRSLEKRMEEIQEDKITGIAHPHHPRDGHAE
jgi:hypothetical protein